jgi:hypothetical protein
MGLFSKKTDAEIIAEARALYIEGDLTGADLKLIKLAQKGNPDACYWSARIQLEIAEKKKPELYMKAAKINLEKAVAAGHKEAIALMEKKFGGSIYTAKADEKLQKDIKENTGIIETSVQKLNKNDVVDVDTASKSSGVAIESKNTSKHCCTTK